MGENEIGFGAVSEVVEVIGKPESVGVRLGMCGCLCETRKKKKRVSFIFLIGSFLDFYANN